MKLKGKVFGELDLARKAAKSGTGHKILVTNPELENSKTIINGKFELAPMQAGFSLHTWEGQELEDAVVSINLPPSVAFSIVLEGRLSFSIDGQELCVNKKNDKRIGNNCFAMNLLKPAHLKRKIRKGAQMRKVNIIVDPKYLAVLVDQNIVGDVPINYFLGQHLELPTWQASKNLIRIAEQILRPPMVEGMLRKLYIESKSLEFVIESLQAIRETYSQQDLTCSQDGGFVANSLQSKSKLGKIKAEIDKRLISGELQQHDKCLEEIAQSVGMSVSSLQRVFKKNFGQTVVMYVRLRRLTIARRAIEEEKVSIGEAAYLAGYKHTSNFSIAFKRTFGISPGALSQS